MQSKASSSHLRQAHKKQSSTNTQGQRPSALPNRSSKPHDPSTSTSRQPMSSGGGRPLQGQFSDAQDIGKGATIRYSIGGPIHSLQQPSGTAVSRPTGSVSGTKTPKSNKSTTKSPANKSPGNKSPAHKQGKHPQLSKMDKLIQKNKELVGSNNTQRWK